jgi:hypothetical protein
MQGYLHQKKPVAGAVGETVWASCGRGWRPAIVAAPGLRKRWVPLKFLSGNKSGGKRLLSDLRPRDPRVGDGDKPDPKGRGSRAESPKVLAQRRVNIFKGPEVIDELYTCSKCGQGGFTTAGAISHLGSGHCKKRQAEAQRKAHERPPGDGPEPVLQSPVEDRRTYGVKVALNAWYDKHAFALLPTRATANRVRRTLQELDRRIAGGKLGREITPEERAALAELASSDEEKRCSPRDIVNEFLRDRRAGESSQVTWTKIRKGGEGRRE